MASSKVKSNLLLVNAPAGSGKTHFIRDTINSIVDKDSASRILCITYTDRAAKELQGKIYSDKVYISTIHSFINDFISPYYGHSEVIELYYTLYKHDVERRIEENKSLELNDLENKNSQYLIGRGLQPQGLLTVNIIKENIESLYYNERNYNSLYYGGLSHDNLLGFAFSLFKKIPILQFRLREMFQYIFVDEVQDTDEKILRLFYDAVKDTTTELYFLGDKMQEIYENYNGEFEEEFKLFDTSLSKTFKYNYRSSDEIVNVLNNLYGRKGEDKQKSKKGKVGVKPKLIICENINLHYAETKSDYDDFLILRLSNRARFAREESNKTMENIFNVISSIYPYGRRINTIDVILPRSNEKSPDIFMDFFYTFAEMIKNFEVKHYAKVIGVLKNHRFKTLSGMERETYSSTLNVLEHDDKAKIKELLNKVSDEYKNNLNYSLKEFLVFLVNENIINNDLLVSVK